MVTGGQLGEGIEMLGICVPRLFGRQVIFSGTIRSVLWSHFWIWRATVFIADHLGAPKQEEWR